MDGAGDLISSPSQSSADTLLSGSSATISSNVHLRSACFRAEGLVFVAITAQINWQTNQGSSTPFAWVFSQSAASSAPHTHQSAGPEETASACAWHRFA